MHLNESLLVIEFRDMNVQILALIRHYEMQKFQKTKSFIFDAGTSSTE